MIRHHSEDYIAESDGRVDSVISSQGVQRSFFSSASMVISINGKRSKKSAKVKEGDSVHLEYEEEVFEGLEAESIPLDILYEDDDILVINKAQGMVVHPGAGVHNGTVANALLAMYGDDFTASEDDRPGIVHRLDKDTSGVMVIAKNPLSLAALQRQFAEHSTEKHYRAIVKGRFTLPHGVIETGIERDPKDRKKYRAVDDISKGRYAKTSYDVLMDLDGYSLLDVRIYTGRTHQIRVHMKHIGHPILGDPIYGVVDPRMKDAVLMLHAYSIEITHPTTGERIHFEAALPERFSRIIDKLSL